MVSRAPRPCSTPGCPNLVTTKAGRCDQHKAEAEARRGTRHQRGYDSKWVRIRAQFLRFHPLCEWCGQAAKEVDHRDGDNTHNKWVNLRPLCVPCHRQRTARDQPGGFMLR